MINLYSKKHVVVLTKQRSTAVNSNDRESANLAIYIKCSCGFEHKIQYIPMSTMVTTLIQTKINGHKIDVLLAQAGIDFLQGVEVPVYALPDEEQNI
jgi:hypothetical protein